MPVPTDTLWNIKRLNKLFAVSALLMMGSFVWAIMQDYDKEWRRLQVDSRQWQAAIVDEKIQRTNRALEGEKRARLDTVNARIEDLQARFGIPATPQTPEKAGTDPQNEADKSLIRKRDNDIDNLSLRLNNLKAEVGVMEGALQDARTRGNAARIAAVTDQLKQPAAQVAEWSQQIYEWNAEKEEARRRVRERTKELDALLKERKVLEGDIASLQKQRDAAVPASFLARTSEWIRTRPLLQFMNPAESVKQVVLPEVQLDLSFTKTVMIDRCVSCHVNVDKKEFSREKVVEFLEEELAAQRGVRLPKVPETRLSAPQATIEKPGAAALPEFWHHWGWQLKSSSILSQQATRAGNLAKTVAARRSTTQPVQVDYNGQPVDNFSFNAAEADPAASQRQHAILAQLLRVWSMVPPAPSSGNVHVNVEAKSPDGKVVATIKGGVDAALLKAGGPREAALLYAEAFKKAILAQLPKSAQSMFDDKYRFALTREVNEYREKNGKEPLNPSPVFLAHPRLDLYVDPDSPHPMDAVQGRSGAGCTTCHGGSGMETNFVLAAHAPRSIWVDHKTGEPVFATQLSKPAAEKHDPTLASMLDVVWPPGSVVPSGVNAAHLALQPTHDAHNQVKLKPFGFGLLDRPPHGASPTEYLDPLTGNKSRAVPQLAYWRKYEPESGARFELVSEYWEWPMRNPDTMQANCARCHSNLTDIADEAPILYQGRTLFARLGCVNCHQMDSIPADDPRDLWSGDKKRGGTDLRNVDAKLSPAFLNSWIWAPKAFRPSTLMPHFFMLENNSSDEEIRRTRLESRAITEYLLATANRYPQQAPDGTVTLQSWQPKHKPDPKLKGNAAEGQKLFNTIGCMSCHTNLGDREDEDFLRGERWILRDLIRHAGLSEEDAQKQYEGMSYNQRQWYAWERFGALTSAGPNRFYPPASDDEQRDPVPLPIFMNAGPELSAIGDKLTAGRSPEQARAWLFDWLKEPRHYSAYTTMPSFRLTDQNALHLAEFLLSQKRKNFDDKDDWKAEIFPVDQPKLNELVAFFLRSQFSPQTADLKAVDPKEIGPRVADILKSPSIRGSDAEAKKAASSMDLQKQQLVFLGQKLITHYGCFNCHAINGMENVASPCANLSEWGQKQVSKLAFEYLDPHKVHDMEHSGKGHLQSIPMVNALGAHAVQIGASQDQKTFDQPVAKNVKVTWPTLEHSRDSWLEQKLRNTRIYDRGRNLLEPVRQTRDGKPVLDKDGYPVVALPDRGKPYDKLKMPTFYLNDEQINSIVTFVVSNRKKLITPKLLAATNDEQSTRLAIGRQIVERYGCVNCHTTAPEYPTARANYPSIHQYLEALKKEDMSKFWLEGPPSLHSEGSKVQFNWLFNFMKNVEPIRPQVKVIMPTFPLTDQEDQAIAAYFNAISGKQAKWLRRQLEPIEKYIATREKAAQYAARARAATQPAGTVVAIDRDSAKPWPGDDWHTQEALATPIANLQAWAKANRLPQMTEVNLDPRRTKGFELDKIHRSLLMEARFLARLSDAPYPLVDSPRPDISDELFARGQQFFYDLECMKCHVLGDPKVVAGFKLAEPPKGPNLTIVHRRLQWRWVDRWTQQTNMILPVGSPMPPFFDGLPAWNIDGLPFGQDAPTLAEMPPDKAAKVKDHMAKYGATAPQQKDLLLTFLYAAGVRNHTVKPPTTQPATAPANKEP